MGKSGIFVKPIKGKEATAETTINPKKAKNTKKAKLSEKSKIGKVHFSERKG